MIKTIRYMSQAVAEGTDFSSNCALISITEPGVKANVRANHLLRLEFDDHDPKNDSNELMPAYVWDDQKLFTSEHARQILNFVAGLPDEIDTLYVHCFMGISRSRAVTCGLREIYEIDINPMSQWQTMNMYVYRVLINEWFGNQLGDAFKEMK